MGQQATSLLTPCVIRGKHGLQGEREKLTTYLKRAEALIAEPEKLERECDFHFRRAGLDADGALRRVELRRLLWTFAHSLGSTELTWESIEALAVVGTLEPHVPVVTSAQFFRCVLKTVHLVAAELRRKVTEVDARLQQPNRQVAASASGAGFAPPRPANPWAVLAEQEGSGAADSASSRSSSRSSISASSSQAQAEPQAPPRHKGVGKGKHRPADRLAANPGKGQSGEPLHLAPFQPAPGGSIDEVAPVNGMMVLVLSNEGTFDPQRLFVGHGMLMLSDPSEAAPTLAQRLLGADGRTAFDLSLLEFVASGEDITRTPVAPVLPSFAELGQPDRQGLDRVLVLGFADDEALCLLFETCEDCDLCHEAVTTEGAGAQEEEQKDG
eukprot:CAMPEP_0179091100 /NCGR_PEP_ID=MMETSP0796-20121207/41598_1 /TAXON_ID=73915 /ORGANISM="Pyrodinium bahamense, Strain pbaha01" /LENGTH=383 /DNA_ID=CAMNT_0020788685 /DNA_START=54 /DNA_END=1205 /DNA_ORIENTATION=+